MIDHDYDKKMIRIDYDEPKNSQAYRELVTWLDIHQNILSFNLYLST